MASIFNIDILDSQIKDHADHGWIREMMNRFPIWPQNHYQTPIRIFCEEIRQRYNEYTGARTIKALKQTSRKFFIIDNNCVAYLVELPLSMRGAFNMIKWSMTSYVIWGGKINYGENCMKTLKGMFDPRFDWYEIPYGEAAYYYNALNSNHHQYTDRWDFLT